MRDERWEVRGERWGMRDEGWGMRDERWEMRDERWEVKVEGEIWDIRKKRPGEISSQNVKPEVLKKQVILHKHKNMSYMPL